MLKEAPDYERQIEAMRTVMQALEPLDDEARVAVLTWISSQLGFRKPVTASTLETKERSVESNNRRQGTVSMVAQKLGAKSARDLFVSAAAHLTFYQDKESFSKDELVACAKEARGWKVDYSHQIASNLKRMMDAGTLFEKSKNVFSLSDAALADIEAKIAS